VQSNTRDKQIFRNALAEVIILLILEEKAIKNLTMWLGSPTLPQSMIDCSLNNTSLPETIEGSYYRVFIHIQLKPSGKPGSHQG
jgi:hypothetical protein